MARLPSLVRYLDRLPVGLDSHPECVVKASVFRDAIEALSLTDVGADLPPVLRELVAVPPPVTTWVPEVQSLAILLALRDTHFAEGDAGLAEYVKWVRARNRRLFSKPLYRALFTFISPERLVSGIGRRWGAFRKGSTLELVRSESGRAELRLRYPARLHDGTTLAGMGGAFSAAAEAAGARDPETVVSELSEREAHYVLRWRP